MDAHGTPDEKRMRLRYEGVCRVCGARLPAQEQAVYERATKTVRCLSHTQTPGAETTVKVAVADEATVNATEETVPETAAEDDPDVAPPIEAGVAGASARREFERRKALREQRIRGKHPLIGGLVLALSDEPQSTNAWNTGALGEERLGTGLDSRASETIRVLHDRLIPRSRANIDHLAVTAAGVHVIDAKKYTGRPQLEITGGLLRPRVEKLLVGRRDCTSLVAGMHKQMDVVRSILGDDVPVHGALCFVDADWPLFGGAFTTQGVDVLWPRKLYARLGVDGPLDVDAITATHRLLAGALRPA